METGKGITGVISHVITPRLLITAVTEAVMASFQAKHNTHIHTITAITKAMILSAKWKTKEKTSSWGVRMITSHDHGMYHYRN